MAASFLILQYVRFEWSYDHFHKDHERIYRVITNRKISSGPVLFATTHPGVAPALKAEFAEVQESARIVPPAIFLDNDMSTWSYSNDQGIQKVFNEDAVYNVDPSFLTLFSFPFVSGDPATALDDPSAIVISESTATKYFGKESPVGKTLTLNNDRRFTVTGVFKDIASNSHIRFDMLVSYFFKEGWGGQWSHKADWKWPEFYTYVKLAPEIDPRTLDTKLDLLLMKYMGSRMKEMAIVERIQLQPLTDIHLRSPRMAKEREARGNAWSVYFMLVVATLILTIAWINYINLSTSKAVERAREVGLRKVVGAHKWQLVSQFLCESAALNLLAIAVSFLLVVIVYPYFIELTGKGMVANFFASGLLSQSWFWLSLLAVFLTGSFGAGIYPAFVLSSFRITLVLKGKFFGSRLGVATRMALIGFQFVISIVLIAGTITVLRQVDFMRSQELGYVKDQLLVVKGPSAALVKDSLQGFRKETFKTELLKQNPRVRRVTISTEIPGKFITQINSIRKSDDGPEAIFSAFTYYVDSDFIDTYGMALAAGRNFTPSDDFAFPPVGENPVLLTERGVKALGYLTAEEAVGQEIEFGTDGVSGHVVGVVKDFHQASLSAGYRPILFMPSPRLIGEYFTMNVEMKDIATTIRSLEGIYKEMFPGNEFSYFFLDEFFDRQYAADQQFVKVFGLFASLALVVTSLGLFGLSTFMISQRTKEIAVRKVLGAHLSSIIYLFSRDFLRLLILANLIAIPAAWFFAQSWLENFAFRTDIGLVTFVVPTLILLVVSLVTVSVQTLRTGLKNPILSLRVE